MVMQPVFWRNVCALESAGLSRKEALTEAEILFRLRLKIVDVVNNCVRFRSVDDEVADESQIWQY